jgi:hypothetical protein
MRLALFATTVLTLTLIASANALACDCVTQSSADNLKNAAIVFEGKLVAIRSDNQGPPFAHAYFFDVNRSLKGPELNSVMIYSTNSDCDAEFYPDQVYRVYARDDNGTFRSSLCSGNEILPRKRYVAATYLSIDHGFGGGIPSRWVWERWFMQALEVCCLGVLLGVGTFVWRRYLMKLP